MVLAVFTFINSCLELVKISLFNNNLEIFIQLVQGIKRYTETINIFQNTLIGVVAFAIWIKIIILKRKEKLKIKDIKVSVKNLFIVISIIGLLIVSAQSVFFERNQKRYYYDIDFNDIDFEYDTNEDAESMISLMNIAYEKNDDYFIEKALQNIYDGKNVKYLNQDYVSDHSILDSDELYHEYLEEYKPYIEDEYSRTFRDWMVCYEEGEYQLLEFEYCYTEGREFNECYTLILYGTTIRDELVICIHNIIDTHSLTYTFLEDSQEVRKHQYYYEVLSNK